MMWESSEDAIASVDAQIKAAQERADAAARLNQQLDELRSVGTSRAGVAVQVDASGRLTGIDFTAHALRLTPRRLATAVMEAVGEAAKVSAQNVGFLAGEAFGEGDALAKRVHEEAISRIPESARKPESEITWR